MMYMMHATFKAYLPSILASGLWPDLHKNWDRVPGVYVVKMEDREDAIENAVSFCEAAEYTPDDIMDSGIVCLEILNYTGPIEPDPNIDFDEQPPHSFKIAPVPPENLRVIYP